MEILPTFVVAESWAGDCHHLDKVAAVPLRVLAAVPVVVVVGSLSQPF